MVNFVLLFYGFKIIMDHWVNISDHRNSIWAFNYIGPNCRSKLFFVLLISFVLSLDKVEEGLVHQLAFESSSPFPPFPLGSLNKGQISPFLPYRAGGGYETLWIFDHFGSLYNLFVLLFCIGTNFFRLYNSEITKTLSL